MLEYAIAIVVVLSLVFGIAVSNRYFRHRIALTIISTCLSISGALYFSSVFLCMNDHSALMMCASLISKIFFSHFLLIFALALFHFQRHVPLVLFIYSSFAIITFAAFVNNLVLIAKMIASLSLPISMLIGGYHFDNMRRAKGTTAVWLVEAGFVGGGVNSLVYAFTWPFGFTNTDFLTIEYAITAIFAILIFMGLVLYLIGMKVIPQIGNLPKPEEA